MFLFVLLLFFFVFVSLPFSSFSAVTRLNATSTTPSFDKDDNNDDNDRALYELSLSRLHKRATSDECKKMITRQHRRYMQSYLLESPFPFESDFYHSQCDAAWTEHPPLMPVLFKEIPNRPESYSYLADFYGKMQEQEQQEQRQNASSSSSSSFETLSILYILLVHDHASFAKRLVRALNEPQHFFVIHVDAKPSSSSTYHALEKEYLSSSSSSSSSSSTSSSSPPTTTNVFLVPKEMSVRVTWGGFSVVNATLQAMRYAWNHTEIAKRFDYMIDISGTSYPIKSNAAIRKSLSLHPGAVYMDVQPEPSHPSLDFWHDYVECDDALHRIARLSLLRGMNMHIGSQWFAIPRHVMHWFLHNELPEAYTEYAQHVVVADENYFATLIKNSPFCENIFQKNMLFVLFDKWENERNEAPEARDERKCLHPDPDHCGRSPTTLHIGYKKLLEISRHLFARKFDPNDEQSMQLVDMLDEWRAAAAPDGSPRRVPVGDEGRNIMLRQRQQQQHSHEPDLCLAMLPEPGQLVRMVPCDALQPSQWFTLGPCTDNTNITFVDGACALPPSTTDDGNGHHQEDMFCQLQGWSSQRNLCLDLSGESPHAGTPMISWECSGQWNQLFRFMPDCSVSTTQPDLIGNVRGFENRNVTLCMETTLAEDGGYVLTVAECLSNSDSNNNNNNNNNNNDSNSIFRDDGTSSSAESMGQIASMQHFDALTEFGDAQLAYRSSSSSLYSSSSYEDEDEESNRHELEGEVEAEGAIPSAVPTAMRAVLERSKVL